MRSICQLTRAQCVLRLPEKLALGAAILASSGGGQGQKLLSPPRFDRCLESVSKDSVRSMLAFGSKMNALIASMLKTLIQPVWLSTACWLFAQFSYWESSNSALGVCWEVPGNVCLCQKHLMLTDRANSTFIWTYQAFKCTGCTPKDFTHLIWGHTFLWFDQPVSTFPKDSCRGFPSLLSCLMSTRMKCVSRTGLRNTDLIKAVSQYR